MTEVEDGLVMKGRVAGKITVTSHVLIWPTQELQKYTSLKLLSFWQFDIVRKEAVDIMGYKNTGNILKNKFCVLGFLHMRK